MHRCDNLTDWEKDLIVLIAARADMTGERVFLMRKRNRSSFCQFPILINERTN